MKEGLKRPKSCPFDCIRTCDVTHSPYCIMLALYNAFKGRLQNGYAFCGANAWRAEKIQSVRDLMASLRAEYDAFAARRANFSLRDRLFGREVTARQRRPARLRGVRLRSGPRRCGRTLRFHPRRNPFRRG